MTALPTNRSSVPAARSGTDAAGRLPGGFLRPDDAGYDTARVPWNVAVDQRPAAVASPRDTAEVASVVRAAAAAGPGRRRGDAALAACLSRERGRRIAVHAVEAKPSTAPRRLDA